MMSTEPKSISLEIVKRAFTWLNGRDIGMSSEAILGHMLCGVSDGSYPHDPADLGRCLRLLELFPQWKGRIGEMSEYGNTWGLLAENWSRLEATMADEVGIDWSKGREAHKTYSLMKIIHANARNASRRSA